MLPPWWPVDHKVMSGRGGGGGAAYSWEFLVGVCRPFLQILSLFQTKKCHKGALNVCSGTITCCFETIVTSSLNLNIFFCNPTMTSKIHTRFQTQPVGRNYVIITQIRAETKNFSKCISVSHFFYFFLFHLELKRQIRSYAAAVPSKTIPVSRPKWAKCKRSFSDQTEPKTIPVVAAHTYKAYIREYSRQYCIQEVTLSPLLNQPASRRRISGRGFSPSAGETRAEKTGCSRRLLLNLSKQIASNPFEQNRI